MLVVHVRVMDVVMHNRLMPVPVTVRPLTDLKSMLMVMMQVMHMSVLMLYQLMTVLMTVTLAEMQIKTQRHQKTRGKYRASNNLMQ